VKRLALPVVKTPRLGCGTRASPGTFSIPFGTIVSSTSRRAYAVDQRASCGYAAALIPVYGSGVTGGGALGGHLPGKPFWSPGGPVCGSLGSPRPQPGLYWSCPGGSAGAASVFREPPFGVAAFVEVDSVFFDWPKGAPTTALTCSAATLPLEATWPMPPVPASAASRINVKKPARATRPATRFRCLPREGASATS
jgi:hypothetical protein